MPIAVQTPTGTIYMEIDEYLRYSDEDLRSLYASNEIDPLSVKVPTGSKDVFEDFDLPDLPRFDEKSTSKKEKRK